MQFGNNGVSMLYQLPAAVLKVIGFDNDGYKGLFDFADIGTKTFGHHHLHLPVANSAVTLLAFLRAYPNNPHEDLL
jgi:hypothetical protein